MTIKYFTNYASQLSVCLIAILFLLTGMLYREYRAAAAHTHKVFELRQDYRNHLMAVRKIVDDYNELKQVHVDPQKKKKFIESVPEGARVFSSDDDCCSDGLFVVINRDLDYLKESTFAYFKENNLTRLTSRLNEKEWCAYTQEVMERNQRASQKKTQRIASSKPRVRGGYSKTRAQQSDMVFSWPIKRSQFWLSSFFGPRKKSNGQMGFHYGVDMAALRGTPVNAAASGVVVEAGYVSGYGNTIVVNHSQKYKTRYAHLDKILVSVGQKVTRGGLIARVGDTGSVRKKGTDASHLHFEVYMFGKKVNPMYFLA